MYKWDFHNLKCTYIILLIILFIIYMKYFLHLSRFNILICYKIYLCRCANFFIYFLIIYIFMIIHLFVHNYSFIYYSYNTCWFLFKYYYLFIYLEFSYWLICDWNIFAAHLVFGICFHMYVCTWILPLYTCTCHYLSFMDFIYIPYYFFSLFKLITGRLGRVIMQEYRFCFWGTV